VTPLEVVAAGLLCVGVVFFVAGTVGLLRFPDVYTRLHALTKADNLGLGFVVIGLALGAETALEVAKLAIVWALVMVSSSVSCQLIARAARRDGVAPWRRR
jgi:multicomponent Na+:H+ antiporter subunit G